MIYSYQQYTLLLEGQREKQLRAKYIDKLGMSIEIFDKFFANKNTEWLLKTYSNTTKEKIKNIEEKGTKYEDLLIQYAEKFDNNKENLSINKISKLDNLDDMRDVLNELKDFDSAENTYGDDIWVLSNTYEWFIYKPYTYKVSEEFGNNKSRQYNWCTAYDDSHFKDHFGPEGGLLYCVNKLDYKKDIAFQMNDSEIKAWDWEDNNKHTSYSIENICNKLWNDKEEPYKVIMENLYEIEKDMPSIDYEEARRNAEDSIRSMNLSEFEELFPIGYIWYNIKDDQFLSDQRENETERFYDEWKYQNNLLEMFIELLRKYQSKTQTRIHKMLYNDHYLKIIKKVKDYFIPKMKEANEENEDDQYVTDNPDLEDIIIYINDTYTNDNKHGFCDGVELIEKFNFSDDIVETLADNEINNYRDAEDYVSQYWKLESEEALNMIENYIDWDELAKKVVGEMSEEELRNYL